MANRRMSVEALVAPGKRRIITSAMADSVEQVLQIASGYHGVVDRPWVFDTETGEVLYRWSPSPEGMAL